jgi:cytochrome c peroxidase
MKSRPVSRAPRVRSLAGRAQSFALAPSLVLCLAAAPLSPAQAGSDIKLDAATRAQWVLPPIPPSPPENAWNETRAELGKALFFDPRLSTSSQVTCGSCHFPDRGWTDGLPTAMRFLGTPMRVATPSLTNIGYNSIFMWDGRQPTLEQQAVGGQGAGADVNAGGKVKPEETVKRLAAVPGYRAAFERAYPGEGVTTMSIAKALSSFERSLVSRDSPFDRWAAGQDNAMTPQQINGFKVFLDPQKGACVLCHQPPNFTDNGFHNLGLKSYGAADPLPGRGKHKPIKMLDGAFKTPSLRDVALTPPYFHDGSARTLAEVVEHYMKGGEVRTNLSPSFRKAVLSEQEKADLVAFMEALTTPTKPFVYPVLPQ